MNVIAQVDKIPQEILSLLMPYMYTFDEFEFSENERIKICGGFDNALINDLIHYLVSNTKILNLKTDNSEEKIKSIEIFMDTCELTKANDEKKEFSAVVTEKKDSIKVKEEFKETPLEVGGAHVKKVSSNQKKVETSSVNIIKKGRKRKKKAVEIEESFEKFNLSEASNLLKYIVKKSDISFDTNFDSLSINEKVAFIFSKMNARFILNKLEQKYILLIFQDAVKTVGPIQFHKLYMHVAFALNSYAVREEKALKYMEMIINHFCNEKVSIEVFLRELQKVTRLTNEQLEKIKLL